MNLKIKNKILCILLVLITLFAMTGTNYANPVIDVSLSLPVVCQVYKPGNIVEISGTAQGLSEIALTVRNAQNTLVFAAQPKVKNGSFNVKFTLDPKAEEGEYTLLVGSIGLHDLKRNFIVSNSTAAKINIEKPETGKQFKPGEEIELAGTALNIDAFTVCVRNHEGGRVFVDEPSFDAVSGAFLTRFRLPEDTISGQYSMNVNSYGFTNTINNAFTVASSGSDNPGDDPSNPTGPVALTIKGSGVNNDVSFSRSELEAMKQEKTVFSVTSDYPEDLKVAAKGVPLKDLLDKTGLKSQAKTITFKAKDGYEAKFTVDELLKQSRYSFPGKKRTEALIALERVERSSDFSNMSSSETPVLCFGQRAETEQTLFSFVKYLKTITVETDTPGEWAEPTAKIAAFNSTTKTTTRGGRVQSGSNVYLEGEAGGKIYYTTDGSTPNLDSTIFNLSGCGPKSGNPDPIVITKNTIVKAMVVGRGKTDSKIVTYQFTTGDSENTSVVEQKIDESNLKKEIVDLGNGRKEEKITLLAGVVNDIDKAKKGTCLIASTTNDTDRVRLEVSADTLIKAQKKGMLIGLESQNGKYLLPLNILDYEKTATELGSKSDSLVLNIVISKAAAEVKAKLKSKVGEGQQIMCDPMEFSVVISAPGGKTKTLSSFGGTYVERSIGLSGDVDSKKAIGVIWNDGKGIFTPVPTRFETKNNKKYAVILSRTNSLYLVLKSDKSFADITNNWAKEDIELLASKLLISGKSRMEYAPKSNVTRAEFAALLVRALGLEEGTLKEGQYKDVAADAWYAGYVATAAREKIISGYSGDLFKPNKSITREEMTVMIARAAMVAGINTVLTENEQTQLLTQLKDNAAISSWAKSDVALAVKAGIIKGTTNQNFSPDAYADRAQSAAILKRFLVYVNFMS